MRTIDSASPWCSWLSSQCLPWLPHLDYARLVGVEGARGCWGPPGPGGTELGSPSVPQETVKKESGLLTLMVAERWWPRVWAMEGEEASVIPALRPQSPHPTQGHPLFLPRGCVSLQITGAGSALLNQDTLVSCEMLPIKEL